MEQWVERSGPWLGNQLQLALGNASGGNWYASVYKIFAGIALAFLPLFYVLALLTSTLRGDGFMAVKAALLWTPGACIGTACVIWMMTQALQLTDALCAYVLSTLGQNLTGLLTHTGVALAGAATLGLVSGGGADVVAFAGALAFLLAVAVVMLELAMRLAGIYIAGCFLPLTLAAAVWPSARHLLKLHLESLLGLVLVKFFVVGTLVIGAFAFTASPLSVAPGGEPGLADILTGAMVMVLAALMPFSLLKILPWTAGQVTADLGARTAGAARRHWQQAGNTRQMIVDRLHARRAGNAVERGGVAAGAIKGAAKGNIVIQGARVVVSSAGGVLSAGPPDSRIRVIRNGPKTRPPAQTTRTPTRDSWGRFTKDYTRRNTGTTTSKR